MLTLLLLLAACSSKLPEGAVTSLDPLQNQPIFIQGSSEKAVVLLHGLTATPWEVKPLAKYLAARNITVYAPVLPGHASTLDELEGTKWQSWLKVANESYTNLSKQYKKVFVGGVSLGGDLALLIAARQNTTGVISIASPIWLKEKRTQFLWLLKYFVKYSPREVKGDEKLHYYEAFPTKAVDEMMEVVARTQSLIPLIEEPVLILQSRNDSRVEPRSAVFIEENLGSEKKELFWVEGNEHVVVKEGNDAVLEKIYNFISEN